MAILIPNFELAEKIGGNVEIEAETIDELIRIGIERYGEPFQSATKHATISVNGRAIQHLKGGRTRLSPGDRVWFVVAAAGG